jgi:hypothetical protein
MFIDAKQLFAHSVCQFSAEASELRWPPGVVPTQVSTNIGNGRDLILQGYDSEKFKYLQSAGCIEVTVYND